MAGSCTFPPGWMCRGWARLTPAGSSPGGHPGVPCSRGPQLPAPVLGPLSTCGRSREQRSGAGCSGSPAAPRPVPAAMRLRCG